MKILLMNGSPKGKRSNSLRLAYSFIEGLKKEYTVICGGMLSGRMDNFSKARLKNEIKEALPKT